VEEDFHSTDLAQEKKGQLARRLWKGHTSRAEALYFSVGRTAAVGAIPAGAPDRVHTARSQHRPVCMNWQYFLGQI
jgi:hypothetical protein